MKKSQKPTRKIFEEIRKSVGGKEVMFGEGAQPELAKCGETPATAYCYVGQIRLPMCMALETLPRHWWGKEDIFTRLSGQCSPKYSAEYIRGNRNSFSTA